MVCAFCLDSGSVQCDVCCGAGCMQHWSDEDKDTPCSQCHGTGRITCPGEQHEHVQDLERRLRSMSGGG